MATKELMYEGRKVSYTYNEHAAWTELDQQLADALFGLAEREAALERDVKAAMERAGAVDKELKAVAEQTTAVREVLRAAQTAATDYVAALQLGRTDTADAFAEAVNAANDAIHDQHDRFTDQYEAYCAVIEDHKALLDRMDSEGEEWDAHMHVLIVRACQTDGIATDAVSFDQAHQDLLGILTVHSDHQKDMLQYMLDVAAEHDQLHERIAGQQEVFGEYCERLKVIDLLSQKLAGAVQVGLN